MERGHPRLSGANPENKERNEIPSNSIHYDPSTVCYDVAEIMGGLYGPGFIGLKGAFSRAWVQQLHEDVMKAYQEALVRPNGAVGRGPKRHYVEIHPEDIHGFVDLAMH